MKKVLVAVIIGLGVFGWVRWWSLIGVDTNHDGISFKPVWDMAGGKILYREVFSHYGPLTNYVHFAALNIWGAKLTAIKTATAVAYVMTAVLIWWLGKKTGSSKSAMWGVIIWLSLATYYYQHFYTWASVYGTLMHLLVGCWLVRTIDRGVRDQDGVILGILAGTAFWFKQPYLLTFLVLLLIFWLKWKDKVKFLALGFGGVAAVMLVIIGFSGGLGDWFKQNIRVGYINGRVLASENTWQKTWEYFGQSPLWLLIVLESGWITWRLRKNKYFPVVLLLVALLVNYWPLLDDSHMYWAVTPVIIIWVYSLRMLFWERKSVVKWLLLAITVGVMGLEIDKRIELGYQRWKKNNQMVTTPKVLMGMKTDKKTADDLAEISRKISGYLDAHPSKKMVSLSMDALYMTFDSKTQNVETMYCDLSGYTSGVYPYFLTMEKVIIEEKPLVLEDIGKIAPEGYEIIGVWMGLNKVLFAPISIME